ncbi:CIA30 family protein [Acidobacteriota bacterium]
MKSFLGGILIVFIIFLLSVFTRNPLTGNTETTAIKDVRIFDGVDVIPKGTVVFQDGKITAVGKDALIPAGAKVIDGSEKTLLPGLMDAHIHLISPELLKQSLVFGVTTNIDMFMDVKVMSSIKKKQAEGKAHDAAHLISPGTLVTAPGGHGTQYGIAIPTITKPEEAQKFVDDRIAEGSDFIKIIYEDGSAFNMTLPTINKEILTALVKAAHKRKKIAVVHACSLEFCHHTFEAGADGLVHLYFDGAYDPEFGRIAASKNIFVIPTLSVLESMSGIKVLPTLDKDPHLSPYLTPQDIGAIKTKSPINTGEASYRAAEKALRQLKEAGVPILAGTDMPNPGMIIGASLHRELELLVAAGLTPLEALRGATSIPAEKFSVEGRGLIKPGYQADLLLVNGDPTKDVKATREILDVWKDGYRVDRAKYLAKVKKALEGVEKLKAAPPPEYALPGLISDFEGAEVTAKFGAGWSVSTDAMMGGKSKAEYEIVKGGAQESKGSLLITGNIVGDSPAKWAGALFSPGKRMMMPANLSFKKSISFWAKGDGKSYAILIFAQSLGYQPATQSFTATPEWKEYVFTYQSFGLEGYDIMGIFIGGSMTNGPFSLQIDDVRLK